MKKIAGFLFFSILMLAVIFTMGCSSSGPSVNQTPSAAATTVTVSGFVPNNLTTQVPLVNFGDASDLLAATTFDYGDGTSGPGHIHLIHGIGLDENANATAWLFTVEHGNQTSLVSFDTQGQEIMNWSSVYPQQEIFLSSIIQPYDLFEKNKETISPVNQSTAPESRDLVLANNNYTLTITGTGIHKVFTFDATTGALISTHD